jgi:hypothetical protein
VLGWGAVGGVVVGATVSALTVADLARSAVPAASDAVPTALLIDIPSVGLALGGSTLAIVAIVATYGALVKAQARTLAAREDAR